MIYFDNAATSYPKPSVVYEAHDAYLRHAANPGRGAHELAMECARIVHEARMSAAELLGIKRAERLIFTPGCTYALNMVIKGLSLAQGDVVVVSALEHNAVMRPLRQLELSHGIKIVVLPYASQGIVDLHQLVEVLLRDSPKLCVIAETSNVTGEVVDLPSIAAICAANKVPLAVDAAQSAGHIQRNIVIPGLSFWCTAGHKGLFGPPGVGLLYVAEDMELTPLVSGGTGSFSESFDVPITYPDRLEVGTLPGSAIAGLGAGARWLLETGISNVIEHERALVEQFLGWAGNQAFMRVYGNRKSGGTAVISFEVNGTSCDKVAHLLNTEYGIAIRSGLFCAAVAHQALGTIKRGLARVSFGYFNTAEEVDQLCKALEKIAL